MRKQNQQPDKDFRKQFRELRKELGDIKRKYPDLERIHKYTTERKNKRIWDSLHCRVSSIQRFHDLEGPFYDENKLMEKQQEEIRTLVSHVKLLEEEKIKMISIANEDLHRQEAFTLDSYNLHHSQHKAFINLLIKAIHARRLAETNADRWPQRFKKKYQKETPQSVHLPVNDGALFEQNE